MANINNNGNFTNFKLYGVKIKPKQENDSNNKKEEKLDVKKEDLQFVSVNDVESLPFDKFMELAQEGKLPEDDVAKWLVKNATKYSYVAKHNTTKFDFEYQKQEYSITLDSSKTVVVQNTEFNNITKQMSEFINTNMNRTNAYQYGTGTNGPARNKSNQTATVLYEGTVGNIKYEVGSDGNIYLTNEKGEKTVISIEEFTESLNKEVLENGMSGITVTDITVVINIKLYMDQILEKCTTEDEKKSVFDFINQMQQDHECEMVVLLGVINDVFNQMDSSTLEKKLEILNLIESMYEANANIPAHAPSQGGSQAPSQNSNPTDITDFITQILNNGALYCAYMLNCDGEYGNITASGGTSFVSGLMSLLQTEAGKNALKDVIQWADDYSCAYVKVGNMTIELSASDIKTAKENAKIEGDDDVLILQLALNSAEAGGYIGHPYIVWERFLPDTKAVETPLGEVNKWLEQLVKYAESGSDFAAAFEMGGKAYAVVEVKDGKITYCDPSDTSQMKTMSFDDFKQLNSSKELNHLYSVCYEDKTSNAVSDGVIGEFSIGDSFTGICTSISALNSTEKGREVIEEVLGSIQWLSDTKFTVKVPGRDGKLTVDLADCKLVKGDRDAQLLSAIMYKLLNGANRSAAQVYWNAFFGNSKTTAIDSSVTKDDIEELLKNLQNNKDMAANFALNGAVEVQCLSVRKLNGEEVNDRTFKCTDARPGWTVGFAITNITSNTISFIGYYEEGETPKEYTMSLEDFKKLPFGSISTVNLSDEIPDTRPKYTMQALKDKGLTEEQITIYFDLVDGQYALKEGIKINGKQITTVEELVEALKPVVIDEPEVGEHEDSDVGQNENTKSEDELTAEYIIANLNTLKNSSNANLKEFINLINGDTTHTDKLKLVYSYIKLYNQNNEPKLTKDNIKSMTDSAYTVMNEDIKNSVALKYTYACDGEIGNYINENCVNSRLVAALQIIQSPIYQSVLDSLEWDKNYEKVRVKIPATGEYTKYFSLSEKFSGKVLVSGDEDVVLMTYILKNITAEKDATKIFYAFFGDNANIRYDNKVYASDIDALLKQAYYAKQNGKNFAANFVLNKKQDLNTIDGDGTFKIRSTAETSYIITDITENTVTFEDINGVSHIMAWTEFRKTQMASLTVISFNNITEPITLLDRKDGANPEFIVNNLAMLKDRENETVVTNFVSIIDSAFDNFECFYMEDQIDFLEKLMEFYYREKNITAPQPLKFTKDVLNNLDLAKIKEIISSSAFYCAVNYDGLVEEVDQEDIGDCWLLASAFGYNTTPAGREAIKNAISWNEDYTEAYLKLHDNKGIERIITISADDIKAACEQQYKFSGTYTNKDGTEVVNWSSKRSDGTGRATIAILELGFQFALKYNRKADREYTFFSDEYHSAKSVSAGKGNLYDDINGGRMEEFSQMLYGGTVTTTTLKKADELLNVLEKVQNNTYEKTFLGASISAYAPVNVTTLYGDKIQIYGGHSHSLVLGDFEVKYDSNGERDDNNSWIEIGNPWDSTGRVKISFKELKNIINKDVTINYSSVYKEPLLVTDENGSDEISIKSLGYTTGDKFTKDYLKNKGFKEEDINEYFVYKKNEEDGKYYYYLKGYDLNGIKATLSRLKIALYGYTLTQLQNATLTDAEIEKYYTKKVIDGKTKYIPKHTDNIFEVQDLVLTLHQSRYDKSALLSFYKLTDSQINDYFVYYSSSTYKFYYMKTGLTATVGSGQTIEITTIDELVDAIKKGYAINLP